MSLTVEPSVSDKRHDWEPTGRSPAEDIWDPTEPEIERAIQLLSDRFGPELAATIVRAQVGRPRLSDEALSRESMYE